MKNSDLIQAFANNRHYEGEASNVRCANGLLFSYNTCIAQYVGNGVVINGTRYSNTTSRHQGYLRRAFHGRENVIEVTNVGMGVKCLVNGK